ncbi:phage tail fiber protein [Phreatobacter oligotrophus]|uniref:Uncharacterized protein n=1 Tax=Phreatobacter oligotrophus TaxID=1122261 RepID=A0A2T4ZIU6_9HYPH|nr:hypothetical protein [Phreatobacter oligotrophus]PTM61903.1 hypothetical protein C8P69_101576 [Phreatobacter oligotrophus]
MPASTYAGNKILDLLFRGVAFTAPSRVWISLHTADPGLTGANEVTVGNWPAYARQDPAQAGAVGTGFTAATAKAIENALQVLFPANNGASAVVVTHFAIWDAPSAGNCLFSGALTASKTIAVTDELVIRIGELDLTVT